MVDQAALCQTRMPGSAAAPCTHPAEMPTFLSYTTQIFLAGSTALRKHSSEAQRSPNDPQQVDESNMGHDGEPIKEQNTL